MADNSNDIIAQQVPPTFGNRGPSIFGIKFVDINGDGIRQPNETETIPNIPFILEPAGPSANGVVDAPQEVETRTDANGAFQFSNLAPGNFVLTERVPPGAVPTFPSPSSPTAGTLPIAVGNTDVTVFLGNSTSRTLGSGIVGCKYLDLDGDGFRDGNEPGIKNVRIFLDGSDSSVPDGEFQATEFNTLTDKDGEWSISVPAGTYRVREERVNGPGGEPLEADFLQSTPPNNVPLLDVTVLPGQTFYCAQVGNAPLYQIPVEKFRDLDGNGRRNNVTNVSGVTGLEPGIPDVPFILDLNRDGRWQQGQEPILTTNINGRNAFRNLLPGNYSVLEIFGNQLPGGLLPNDLRTPTSPTGIPGNQNFPIGSTPNPLQVSAPGNGSLFQGSISEDGPLISTDATGYNPAAADNLYDPIVPTGQRPIFVKDTFTPLTNAEPSVTYSPITANPGRPGGVGVGNTRPNINVFKYLDLDGDGVYEPIFNILIDKNNNGVFNPGIDELGLNPAGERPLPGITVSVDLDGDGQFSADGSESRVTDVNGNATFTNVVPRGYQVVEQLDPNSEFIPSTPTVVPVNLSPDRAEDANVRFGNTFKSRITGCKFEDLNQNGYRDGNEPGIAGVTIAIDVNNNGLFDPGVDGSTVSDQFGNWSFEGLLPGLYRVREVTPQGAFKTTQPLDIVLGANQTFTCAVIGNSSRYNLIVPKFRDDNRDGIQQIGIEPDLPNIPFTLDLNRNGRYDPDQGEPLARSGADGVNGALFRDLLPGTYSVLEVFGDPNVPNEFPIATGPNPVDFTVPGPSAVLQGTTPTTPNADGTTPLSSATVDLLTGGTTPVVAAADPLTNGGSSVTQPTSGVDSLLASNAAAPVVTIPNSENGSNPLYIVGQDSTLDTLKKFSELVVSKS